MTALKAGELFWRAGPLDGPVAITGTDFAHIEDGRIKRLSVFVDPARPLTRAL
jgi:hypothetical protein